MRAFLLVAFWLPSGTPRSVAEISPRYSVALPQLRIRSVDYLAGSPLWYWGDVYCTHPQGIKHNKHLTDGENIFEVFIE